MPTYRSNLYQYEPNKIEIKPYKIVLKAPNFLIFLTLPVVKKKIIKLFFPSLFELKQ